MPASDHCLCRCAPHRFEILLVAGVSALWQAARRSLASRLFFSQTFRSLRSKPLKVLLALSSQCAYCGQLAATQARCQFRALNLKILASDGRGVRRVHFGPCHLENYFPLNSSTATLVVFLPVLVTECVTGSCQLMSPVLE
jgi:hypothetical protein